MAAHIWERKRITKKTRDSMLARYALAIEEGYTERESMRWSAFCTERDMQGGQDYAERTLPFTHGNARWQQGASIHASEYIYCKVLGLPMPPRCPHEPAYDGRAGLAVTAYRLNKFFGHLKNCRLSANAVTNIQTVAGPTGLYNTQTFCVSGNSATRRMSMLWSAITKGTDLFVPGAGSFNIEEVVQAVNGSRAQIEPKTLTGVGYAMKYGYKPITNMLGERDSYHWQMEAASFRRVMYSRNHRAHYLRHQEFWNQYEHIDLLNNADQEMLVRNPQHLLESLEGADRTEVNTTYETFKDWPDSDQSPYLVKPIRTSHELEYASRKLHNCANGYHTQLLDGDLVLLLCYTQEKPDHPLAMASLYKGAVGYDQIYGPCNKRPGQATRIAFERSHPIWDNAFKTLTAG